MPRGKTRSSMGLGARRAKARELFAKGYGVAEVARQVEVDASTASRYKQQYEAELRAEARTNPGMLRDVVANTFRALHELDLVREAAWEGYRSTKKHSEAQGYLNAVLKAQDQRAKLFGLLGVKADFAMHVSQVREQQEALIKFMTQHLCPADRIKLEEFLVGEFAGELADMPTAEVDS